MILNVPAECRKHHPHIKPGDLHPRDVSVDVAQEWLFQHRHHVQVPTTACIFLEDKSSVSVGHMSCRHLKVPNGNIIPHLSHSISTSTHKCKQQMNLIWFHEYYILIKWMSFWDAVAITSLQSQHNGSKHRNSFIDGTSQNAAHTSSSFVSFRLPLFIGKPLPNSLEWMSAPYSTVTSSSMLLTNLQNSRSTSSVGTIYIGSKHNENTCIEAKGFKLY